MTSKGILTAILVIILEGTLTASTPTSDSFAAFQKKAARFNSVVTLPAFETNAAQIRSDLEATISQGNKALDTIGSVAKNKISFSTTALALDDAYYHEMLADNRFSLMKETSPDPELREAATQALKKLEEWAVGIEYHEDVYKALKGLEDSKPGLKPVQRRLLDEQLRDFRRAGMALPPVQRAKVEQLRKDLASLSTDFSSNINKVQKPMKFTGAELEGVPGSFLTEIKSGPDQYTVMVNVTYHYLTVMENATREDTRKRLQFERNNLARESNVPLIEKILPLRDEIANALGYKTWADYRTEINMARNAHNAIDFMERLKEGLQPKYDSELDEFRAMKSRQTGDPHARIYIWDWRYFSNQLKKEKYSIDEEQLRVYFPMNQTLNGMFAIYQHLFGLRFERVEPPFKWVDDLQLWAVSDAKTGEPMGLFYLDLFPREGKYNHFASFGLIDGKRLRNGKYQRPVVALVCNFPAPSPTTPSLLSHMDVETLFHEFGHAMHAILTRVDYAKFSGTSVPEDFVEAPSQMLEQWVWDKHVLDSFAADYRDPSKKIPAAVISKLWESRMATEGTRYRRQVSFGLMDLVIHSQVTQSNANKSIELSNRVMDSAFLSRPEDSAFLAYFGHFVGYDAGYYGYAWADAIAADMGTVFKKAPNGLLDARVGRRLRDEIYSQGNSRDVSVSIRKFLGRDRSLEPFLQRLGIKSK